MRRRLWTWGPGFLGGNASGNYVHKPVPAPAPALDGAGLQRISGSWARFYAVAEPEGRESSLVVSWGWKNHVKSQLAVGRAMKLFPGLLHSVQTRLAWGRVTFNSADTLPVAVPGTQGLVTGGGGASGDRPDPVRQLAAGAEFVLMLTESGRLLAYGEGVHGQLGRGLDKWNAATAAEAVPVGVFDDQQRRVVSVSAGFQHAAAVTDDGEWWAWGKGSTGALGIWRTSDKSRSDRREFLPVPVNKANAADSAGEVVPPLRQVSCGFNHTVLLTRDGDVWVCGKGGTGCTADPDFRDALVPRRVETLPEPIESVASGLHHVLALGRSGAVYSWGMSRFGECGRPAEESVRNRGAKYQDLAESACTMMPGLVHGLGGEHRVVRLVAGFQMSAVLTDQGRMLVFGGGKDRAHEVLPEGVRAVDAAFGWKNAAVITEHEVEKA